VTVATPPEGAAPNTPEVSLGQAIPPDELDRLTDDIIAALKTVYDPEIPADIYELGLIYRVEIDDNRNVTDALASASRSGIGLISHHLFLPE
jgi:hypothetical protein